MSVSRNGPFLVWFFWPTLVELSVVGHQRLELLEDSEAEQRIQIQEACSFSSRHKLMCSFVHKFVIFQ